MKTLFFLLPCLPLIAKAEIASMYIPGEPDFSIEACAKCVVGIDDCDKKEFNSSIKKLKPQMTPGNPKFDTFVFADWLNCRRRANMLAYDYQVYKNQIEKLQKEFSKEPSESTTKSPKNSQAPFAM